MNNIGQRIKELRKKNDLTQETLADFIGITYKAVSKWECGMTVPDISLIMPLSRILHVTADELLGEKRKKPICAAPNWMNDAKITGNTISRKCMNWHCRR